MQTPIALSNPRRSSEFSLEAALDARRTCREFASTALPLEALGQLLWAAQGLNAHGLRTAPSAGARYPLEVVAVTADWVAEYQPAEHALLPRIAGDLRRQLARAALEQDFVAQAPLTVVLSAVVERVASRYGEERGARYVHIEVGHAAQNVLLQATALGLGAVPVGAFHDDQVRACLQSPPDHAPLYLMPIGHPA